MRSHLLLKLQKSQNSQFHRCHLRRIQLLSVVEGRDGISFLLAEGESVPGPVLNIGNINSRYRFPLHAREFIDRWSKAGPSHHCAIGVGHVAGAIRKYAALLGIPVTVVC